MELETLCNRASETRLNESGSIGAYSKRCYRARVGQVVYVRSLGVARVPYIAVLRRIRHGIATMQWYFRPEDLPAGTIVPYEPAPTELFLSDTCDDNQLDLVLGPCDVAAKENSTGYFCRASFTGGAISAFTVATREHSLALELEREPPAQKRSCNS
jgi:hypothetical protein